MVVVGGGGGTTKLFGGRGWLQSLARPTRAKVVAEGAGWSRATHNL